MLNQMYYCTVVVVVVVVVLIVRVPTPPRGGPNPLGLAPTGANWPSRQSESKTTGELTDVWQNSLFSTPTSSLRVR